MTEREVGCEGGEPDWRYMIAGMGEDLDSTIKSPYISRKIWGVSARK
jgi:hypothetical protein